MELEREQTRVRGCGCPNDIARGLGLNPHTVRRRRRIRPARGGTNCLVRCIDAPDVRQRSGRTTESGHDRGDERGDRDRRLDGDTPPITQTEVFIALSMIRVNACTMLSPVTTV